MKQKLINILEELGYPIFLQGTLNSENEYPNTFFTFWNFSTPEIRKYDNKATAAEWGFWIEFYSTDPKKVEEIPLKAKEKLEAQDFYFYEKPCDITSNTKLHTATRMTTYAVERY